MKGRLRREIVDLQPRRVPTRHTNHFRKGTPRRALRAIGTAISAIVILAQVAIPRAWGDPVGSEGLEWGWDGPVLGLDWRGESYVSASGSFVGTPVSVPGDRVERSLRVRNSGSSSAVATVQIINIRTTNPAGTANTELERIVRLTWDVAGDKGDMLWADASAKGSLLKIQFPVDKAETFLLKVGYVFPFDATEGRSHGLPSSELSFDVQVSLRGETVPPKKPLLAVTGATAGWVVVVSAVLIGCGWFFLMIARRRRKEEEPSETS